MTFTKFLHEQKIIEAAQADDADDAGTRKSMLALITSYFQRFVNSGDVKDNRSLLLLVAALNILNSNTDDSYAISTAKRLAQMAFIRSGKMKKGN